MLSIKPNTYVLKLRFMEYNVYFVGTWNEMLCTNIRSKGMKGLKGLEVQQIHSICERL